MKSFYNEFQSVMSNHISKIEGKLMAKFISENEGIMSMSKMNQLYVCDEQPEIESMVNNLSGKMSTSKSGRVPTMIFNNANAVSNNQNINPNSMINNNQIINQNNNQNSTSNFESYNNSNSSFNRDKKIEFSTNANSNNEVNNTNSNQNQITNNSYSLLKPKSKSGLMSCSKVSSDIGKMSTRNRNFLNPKTSAKKELSIIESTDYNSHVFQSAMTSSTMSNISNFPGSSNNISLNFNNNGNNLTNNNGNSVNANGNYGIVNTNNQGFNFQPNFNNLDDNLNQNQIQNEQETESSFMLNNFQCNFQGGGGVIFQEGNQFDNSGNMGGNMNNFSALGQSNFSTSNGNNCNNSNNVNNSVQEGGFLNQNHQQ